MAKVITIANQKGGGGKTTTAVSLASALQHNNKTVLLIDLDPQGNLSSYLGGNTKNNITTLMDPSTSLDEINKEEFITRARQTNLFYISSDISLSAAEFFLVTAMNRERILKRVINRFFFDDYDYIIIDCLPSLGILLVNALTAADEVIIPVQAQKLAVDGLELLMKVFSDVKTAINPKLTLGGVLVTMYDNTKMAIAVEEHLKQRFPGKVFKHHISKSVTASYSTNDQIPLPEMRGKLGEEYMRVADEILGGETK